MKHPRRRGCGHGGLRSSLRIRRRPRPQVQNLGDRSRIVGALVQVSAGTLGCYGEHRKVARRRPRRLARCCHGCDRIGFLRSGSGAPRGSASHRLGSLCHDRRNSPRPTMRIVARRQRPQAQPTAADVSPKNPIGGSARTSLF